MAFQKAVSYVCGEHQTLGHILNSCKISLQHRCFNSSHNHVIQVITVFVQEHIPDGYKVVVDFQEDYSFPAAFACTDIRPDLVFCEKDKQAILVGFTVCCESEFLAAKDQK